MAQLDVMESPVFGSGYLAPYCSSRGDVDTSLFHPAGYSLWLLSARLAPGAEVVWDTAHGDEGLYILEGAVEADGARCGPDGAMIVEADGPAVIRAVDDTRLLHFGPMSPPPLTEDSVEDPGSGQPGVHLVSSENSRRVTYDGHPIENRFYADCSCPTCRIVLFTVSCDGPHTAASHLHSEDEIIHVLEGELQVGPQTVRAGMSVAIPAGRRYGFRTPGAYKFINYRRDASTFTGAPGTEPVVEIPAR